MAIKKSDFILISENLYIQKDYSKDKPTKFLFDFTYLKKRYRKVITIDNLLWDKRIRINEAKKKLQEFKEEIRQDKRPDDKITLNQLFELYLSQATTPSQRWKYDQQGFYNLHIAPHIGERKANEIKPLEINRIITDMKKKGYSKAYQARIKRILNPVFKFAKINNILNSNPIEHIQIKIPLKRKIIINPSEKVTRLYTAITTLYKDNPYYQAIFFFGLFGRRKNEVLQLKWEDVDLINGYYWIRKTKAQVAQRFNLPPIILEQLIKIPDEKKGYIFKSPVNPNEPIKEIKRQIKKVREFSEIEDFHFHKMRSILVSALYEKGIPTPILSKLLGHLSQDTLKHYISEDTYQSSKMANEEIIKLLELDKFGL